MSVAENPAEWLAAGERRGSRQPFLRELPGGLSYAELHARTDAWAAALRARGVDGGDRVAVQVDKSVEAVLLYLACLSVGAVYVPINTANTPHEVEYFLRDCAPRLVVVRPGERRVIEPLAATAGALHLDTLGAAQEGSLPEWVKAHGARSARSDAAAADGGNALGQQALAAIVYTSGTTGRAKGAMLTRGNLGSNAAALAHAWRFTADDVLLHALPLFHVHGLFAALNTVLAAGASLVLLPKFDAASVLAHLPAASVYMGVPTHYTRLLQEPALDRRSTADMRLFVSGSAPLSVDTHRQFAQRTGHRILERYGMTETLMNTSNPYDGQRVAGSVGPALPGIAIRVAANPAGAAPSVGEIEIRGPNVCTGYWRDADKSRTAFTADGWFRSGDLGRIDADGYVYIVGRAKDLVISGGYNVYPKEVETELDALPGVLESAVFGVPHPDFGEGVTAAVVRASGAAPSESDLVVAVKARLAGYKIPKRIVFLDELPRNAMGKVQKNALRAAFAALYESPPPAV